MRDDIQFIQQPVIDDASYMRGDTVRLTTANLRHEYQLDVSILRRVDKLIYGSVIAAAPKVDIPPKEWEIEPGQEVVFRKENIAKAIPSIS
ncbi:hypothetical protein AB6825_01275 [Serratia proteamaculans]|jgi:hypothetical protein|uniref:hypothetical protein n=1 Tax=Serratia proteamaculans TaxID=28151 RepID=UPI00217C70D2|nr:hypothetical protein [Serratia proteamaculans]CAI0844749.1 Uncharacterised protein [Serratia proteamaculans]CAI1506745.1 Uncharacterised protein [Serratia proteamaculans]CAI1593256.1 Uncharacterised protein [Serratia proteamaculans]CAI1632217.1 Uncharacterised protein [Serratia proteamaculans]CAI1661252.1 Uncharacterised protein [Serratia proteamaculans]